MRRLKIKFTLVYLPTAIFGMSSSFLQQNKQQKIENNKNINEKLNYF